ncbi:TIGR00375 family protein [archaeon]|nr:TIGR00375 family protein [archaeon]
MKEFNCDLHLHGPFSGGTSKNMALPLLAGQSQLKGLDLIATGDLLHAKWLKHCQEHLIEEKNRVYGIKGFTTKFLLSTEVEETASRTHHLIYFPDHDSAETLRKRIKDVSSDLDGVMSGRPKVHLQAEKLAELVLGCEALIGPSHAFTPYTGLYGYYPSFKACYGNQAENVPFIELGLSADTDLADLLEELHEKTFLSNSDAHSAWPHRIGREFNRMLLKEASFKEARKALMNEGERKITLNCGLDPREGKYHLTACRNCFAKYELKQALKLKWRCTKCKGLIKKGVKDRILELTNLRQAIHPAFRPDYLYLVPLAEIIQLTLKAKSPVSPKVQELWQAFVPRFRNEINVLVDEPIINLMEVHEETAKNIERFREGLVAYSPGGGGDYGRPFICADEKEFNEKKLEIEENTYKQNQKTLTDY